MNAKEPTESQGQERGMTNEPPFIVSWKFRNGHSWIKAFTEEEEAVWFVNACGLVAHPDITDVLIDRTAGVAILAIRLKGAEQ